VNNLTTTNVAHNIVAQLYGVPYGILRVFINVLYVNVFQKFSNFEMVYFPAFYFRYHIIFGNQFGISIWEQV
jgi:hypothetical protein